jgi:hypothetical protein
MSDTAPRNPVGAPQMAADALLRSAGGASAMLRVTGTSAPNSQSEVGLVASNFSDVVVSPVVMRRIRPTWEKDGQPQWEMFVSATSIEAQVSALDFGSAQALFAATLAVTVGGQDYLIESMTANEFFGQVYLYRLLVREARPQAV